jgi:hypothetical protein
MQTAQIACRVNATGDANPPRRAWIAIEYVCGSLARDPVSEEVGVNGGQSFARGHVAHSK